MIEDIRKSVLFILVLKKVIDDTATSNKDRSILLTFLGLYQREIDPQTAVKHLFKRLIFYSNVLYPFIDIYLVIQLNLFVQMQSLLFVQWE
jgi:hypothetical protein